MLRRIAALVVLGIACGVGNADAQDSTNAPGRVEVTYMPASAAFVAEKDDKPSFGNIGFAPRSRSMPTATSASKVRSAR